MTKIITPKKALIYCRVSSKSQEDEGNGLESQETHCRQHAQAKGYQVIEVFPDTITGGGDFMKRKGMVALLAFLDAHPKEEFVVIFDDLKRFARDRDFHFRLRDAFRKRGAIIECLNFRFEDTPEGEFIETIMAAQGQLERLQNGRQVSQKMQARTENGYWIHQAPIGYRYREVKGRGKMLFLDPPYDAMIREAFEGFASGRFATQAEIRRFFESLPNFPRPKKGKVTQERVREILSHPLYAGYICSERYNINWLRGQHEPIVSLETFAKVQERRKGVAYAPKRANIGDQFALRGIAVCTSCNTSLRSSLSRGRNSYYPYYLCQTKGCKHYGNSMKRDKVEEDVGALIKNLQPTQGLIRLATDMFRYAHERKRLLAKEAIKSGKEQIRALDKQIEAFLERITMTDNIAIIKTYEDKIAALTKDKALLTEKVEKQVEPKTSLEKKLEPALQFLANPYRLWEKGNIHIRRTVLKLNFADHIPYDRFEGARTPEIALSFKALEAVSTGECSYGALCRT